MTRIWATLYFCLPINSVDGGPTVVYKIFKPMIIGCITALEKLKKILLGKNKHTTPHTVFLNQTLRNINRHTEAFLSWFINECHGFSRGFFANHFVNEIFYNDPNLLVLQMYQGEEMICLCLQFAHSTVLLLSER